MENQIDIITLPVDEWQVYKDLRLESLRDSPQAFGTSYEDMRSKPDGYWQDRLASAAAGQGSWLLFARQNEHLVGMIGAFVRDRDADPTTATIVSVYVTPQARGTGAARLLMEAILDRLKESGIKKTNLGVAASQTPAVRLYQRFGFVIVGTRHEQQGDGQIHEGLLMEKDLSSR